MTSTNNHPRRRPAPSNTGMTPSLVDCFQNMNIRKGDTFHVPHHADKDIWDPLESKRATSLGMPTRSTTCPKSLEDLLIGAGERRAADLLARVDKAIATQSKLALGHFLSEPEVLPVPTFMVDRVDTNESAAKSTQTRPRQHSHSHSSDSGIGSSVAGSDAAEFGGKGIRTCEPAPHESYLKSAIPAHIHSTAHDRASASGHPMTAIADATEKRGLSEYAKEQINKHIIQPILREQSLREFHQLIKNVPRRIGTKDISTLRDLEKTLIFLAPVSESISAAKAGCAVTYGCLGVQDYSRTPSKYLRFCERTIRVLHTTVTTLHESDQRAPEDRPYTQGYFFDLVEQVCFSCTDWALSLAVIDIIHQIRRYATILAATRQKQTQGKELDEMDYSPYVFPPDQKRWLREAGRMEPAACATAKTCWPVSSVTAQHAAALPPNLKRRSMSPIVPDSDLHHVLSICRDETVSLSGGVTHNGKPAELVRHKDGRTISLATGRVLSVDEVASASMKRPLSDLDALDDDADEDDVMRSMARRKKNAKPEIHECPQCEKDFKRPCDLTKHIKTHERPWKCSEAKCKYHEYGWPTEKERDRHVNDKHSTAPSLYHCLYKPCPYTSKRESNCKQHMEKAHGWNYVRSKNNGKGRASDVTRLPKGSESPASMMMTPSLTPIAPSPSTNSMHSYMESSRRGSMAPPPVPSQYGTPAQFTMPSPDFAEHFNFDFNNMAAYPMPMTPALSDDRRNSTTTSTSGAGVALDGSGFNDAISPDDFSFDNFDFDMAYQQATPNSAFAPSTGDAGMHGHPPPSATMGMEPFNPSATTSAQQDLSFTPDLGDNMNIDDDLYGDFGAPDEDFTLFGGSAVQLSTTGGDMFPSLATEGAASWGNFGGVGGQFDANAAPTMPTDNSALNELFPGLNN